MKKLASFLFTWSVVTGIASAQTTTTDAVASTTPVSPPMFEAAAGLTPESSFYFLDKISESIQELFAFTPEAKVKLQLQFAAERIAEAKAMLASQGDHTKGLDVVKAGLTENIQKTADILKQEKADGKDVSKLAKEANDQLDSEEGDLNKSFAETQKEVVDQKIEATKKLLEEAQAAKDEAKIQAAEQDLNTNQQIAEDLKKKREEIRQSFHEEKKAVEDEMSTEDQAEDQVNNEDESKDATSSPEVQDGIRSENKSDGGIRDHREGNQSGERDRQKGGSDGQGDNNQAPESENDN